VFYKEGAYLRKISWCIACPSTDVVKMLTDLISEKLRRNGIDPVVAIDIRAYGQDIFCTKICGKIIEAQFCIAILDDISESVHGKNVNIPNPNVYYEYGLMTALDKYVIPLQKEGQDLAFNIKTHDTIRYSPGDVSAEIEKALKEAIRITVEERELSLSEVIPVHMYRSFLAINGYQTTSYGWFLRDDLEGTVFQGYKNDKRSENLFFTVIDDKDMLKTAVMDIQVIKRRLNDRFENLVGQIESFSQAINKQEEEIRKEKSEESAEKKTRISVLYFDRQRELNNLLEKKQEASDWVELIKNSKFGVILNPDLVEFKEKCVIELSSLEADALRLPVYFGDISGIQVGDVEIKFKAPEL
jgi:hypothetical protein